MDHIETAEAFCPQVASGDIPRNLHRAVLCAGRHPRHRSFRCLRPERKMRIDTAEKLQCDDRQLLIGHGQLLIDVFKSHGLLERGLQVQLETFKAIGALADFSIDALYMVMGKGEAVSQDPNEGHMPLN